MSTPANGDAAFYMVLICEQWKGLVIDNAGSSRVDWSAMPGIGFAPIFATEAEAKREYPDRQIVPVHQHPKDATS